ncbi:MAG: type II toxin-antitoxin system Phd/YefM family antitoxin [Acidimicrobiia bacterium]|nr:type II toxin-antitoxin system Phd/YefM family antitoxin [Acidimicrobiia bacterium]MYC57415.1 type II toxin-antitoxin system Phd/YefM family antitoxin [Acidimicrobiia bacterium]MYI30253.1 type II toxin-antitoxin system Phd/YefM family antitoxin [Acidimicrobiia bacterium]
MVINVYEAKTHLSKLLDRVAAGEELVLGRAGKPIALLVPYQEVRQPRKPGRLAGKIWIALDFDETPEDIIAAFEGDLNDEDWE